MEWKKSYIKLLSDLGKRAVLRLERKTETVSGSLNKTGEHQTKSLATAETTRPPDHQRKNISVLSGGKEGLSSPSLFLFETN